MEISFFELLIKGIPEGILTVFALYMFCNRTIEKNEFIKVSCSFIALTYFIRRLPIDFGFHTIFVFFTLCMMSNLMLHIDIIVAARALLKIIIVVLVCEGLNMLLINLCTSADVQIIMQDPFQKVFYTIPSTVIYALIDLGVWLRRKKQK